MTHPWQSCIFIIINIYYYYACIIQCMCGCTWGWVCKRERGGGPEFLSPSGRFCQNSKPTFWTWGLHTVYCTWVNNVNCTCGDCIWIVPRPKFVIEDKGGLSNGSAFGEGRSHTSVCSFDARRSWSVLKSFAICLRRC